MSDPILLGVDTGGTFTDLVLVEAGKMRVHKVLSTPEAPERAILQGIGELGLGQADWPRLTVVHGSTVATNAVLEGKGASTVFVTNRGFADLLSIGRQARASLYDLQPEPPQPPLPTQDCIEVGGRIDARGEVVDVLSEDDRQRLIEAIRVRKPAAVAVLGLFAWLDDRFERKIRDWLTHDASGEERSDGGRTGGSDLFVSLSSEVLPEIREFERGMATWLNAYVGPLMRGYLDRLGQGVSGARLSIMQSNGDTVAKDHAAQFAVRLLLSGPAGGLRGAQFVAGLSGESRLLSFDMGGTSTDVALIDENIALTSEGRIGRYPVAVPMIDMHTIGAGGGSIAWLDDGGVLQVGPQSAGADPGPVCYGLGGKAPTVTDANLVLGRLLPDRFLGGAMRLDKAAAIAAMERLGQKIGRDAKRAAEGVLEIANEHMAQALQTVTVQRGIDPRDFTLVSFGGAGGLHVCDLAERLGMRRALVPINAGVLSALGMLAAEQGRYLTHSLPRACRLGELHGAALDSVLRLFAALEDQAESALRADGVARDRLLTKRSVDLRFAGQSYSLTVAWLDDVNEMGKCFVRLHEQRYGHAQVADIELVSVHVHCVAATGQAGMLKSALTLADPTDDAVGKVGVWGRIARENLCIGQPVAGPCIVTETVATTYVARDWQVSRDDVGNLLLEKLEKT